MDMSLGHARHQRRTRRIDHRDAGHRHRPPAARHARYAVALDQHLAGIGSSAGAVDDPYVPEQSAGHAFLPSDLTPPRVKPFQDLDTLVRLLERRPVTAPL